MLVNLKDECFSSIKLPNPGWEQSYVGIPFVDGGREGDALDCWGLIRAVYAHELGIELPSYSKSLFSASAAARRGDAAKSLHQKFSQHIIEDSEWYEVPEGSEQALDAILIRQLGVPIHAALVTNSHIGLMLHTEQGIDSVVQRYKTFQWSSRIVGFYRHGAIQV